MYKKGHTGMIKVKRATEDKPGTLEIKVRIGGNAANTGNVKDLKQLSGDLSAVSTDSCLQDQYDSAYMVLCLVQDVVYGAALASRMA